MDDFYIDPKGLAAYYEVQWLDKLRLSGVSEQFESKSKYVPESFISSNHTQGVAKFIIDALEAESIIEVN